jgi:hypothetical protein
MPYYRIRNKNKQNNRPRQRNNKKRKPKAKKPRARVPRAPNPLVAMLLDPCDSRLVQGAFGDGTLPVKRLTSEITVTVAAAVGEDTSEVHFLWMPKFHCYGTSAVQVSGGQDANVFTFQTTQSNNTLVNTTAVPWANYSGGGTSYITHQDPCYSFVDDASVRDARTIAACAEVRYTGRADSAAGQIAAISELTLGSLWHTESGAPAALSNYSYNQVFMSGREPVRPPTKVEVRYKPEFTNAHQFFAAGESPVRLGAATVDPTYVNNYQAREDDPALIGIAIRGAADTMTYTIRMTKIIEYRPRTVLSGALPTHSQTPITDTPPLQRAVAALDFRAPDWQTVASKTAKSILNSLSGDVAGSAFRLAGEAARAYRAFTGGGGAMRALRASSIPLLL